MRVAFYDKGNLDEKDAYGLGIIYNDNGYLIVAQNEKILGKEMCVCEIGRVIGKDAMDFQFPPYGGDGFLYLTNQRLVYIRKPKWTSASGLGGPATIGLNVMKVKKFEKSNIKECFEVCLNNVIGYEKAKYGANVFVKQGGKVYEVRIFTKYALGKVPYSSKYKKMCSPENIQQLLSGMGIDMVSKQMIKQRYSSGE